VLAPDHTGLTTQEQPTLFWYQSESADVHFELAITDSDHLQHTILDIEQPDAKIAGIKRVNLRDYEIKLAVGVEYEWVVALVVDPGSRSKDTIASGFIKRVEPPATLEGRLATSAPSDRPSIYAEEGIWYDAIQTLAELIGSRPSDRNLQLEEVALLKQVGLTNAAAFIVNQPASR